MPTVGEIEDALYELAPRDLAQSWDNVGLLVGERAAPVTRVLVTLDATREAAEEAVREGCELIVSHHPVMNCAWKPVQTLRGDDVQGRLLRRLVSADVAVICMHTNLDACRGGVNDALAARLGLEDTALLGDEHGVGRMGSLPSPMETADFLALLRKRLRPAGLRFAGTRSRIARVAVGGGSCAGFYPLAAERGCDALVTADAGYHQFLDAAAQGPLLVDAGHFPTEDVICPCWSSISGTASRR